MLADDSATHAVEAACSEARRPAILRAARPRSAVSRASTRAAWSRVRGTLSDDMCAAAPSPLSASVRREPAPAFARPLVLGIETSCDDTACALLDGRGAVLASVVSGA